MFDRIIDSIKKLLRTVVPIESIEIDHTRIERGRGGSGYVDYPVTFAHPVTGVKHEVIFRKTSCAGWKIRVGGEFQEFGPGMLFRELYYQVAEMRLP